jgi:dihydroflavonol-4-reductase
VGNYLCGRLPAIVEGGTNIVDVEDVAEGHLRAAERGRPGERYVLGGHNVTWTAVIDRIAELSGVRRPIVVIQPELAGVARAAEAVGLGVPGFALGEALSLMSQNWQFSSRKAERELGYRARPLDETLGATIDWYRGLIDEGRLDDSRSVAPLAVAAAGMRVARRLRLLDALRRAEPHVGRRLVAGA